MATQYIVIHNKHEGCYDYHCYEDMETRMRITSITINPPKIFLFQTRDQAQDFFEEYMNDIDCLDIRCKKENDEVEHIECCTCGIIECDKNGDPILFYNKKNQIFLLEQKQQFFMPDFQLKSDISNMNLTNRLIHKVRRLDKEQRKKFIELGKYCQDCDNDENNNSSSSSNTENVQIKMEQQPDNDSDIDNDNDSVNENMKMNTIEQVNNVINTLKENMNEIEDEQTKQDIFNIMIKKANEYVEEQNKEAVSAPSIEVSSSVENIKEKKKKSKAAKEPKTAKEPKAAKSTNKKESKTSKKKASSSKTDND